MTAPNLVLGKTEPRIYTKPLPENLVDGELFAGTFDPECDHENNPDCHCWEDRTTDGYACIAFAKDVLGIPLFPWQEWLLIHALELIPDEFGGKVYRFRIVCVSVARQNGKTVVAALLALWHMFALHSSTVIGTAQDLAKADDTWKDAVAIAEGCEYFDDLFDEHGVNKSHPYTFTLFDGCEYRVSATSGDAGRGFSGDLILLDELRTHKDWKTWSAVTNTMNARPEAQCWAFSNAGDATSVVMRYKRAEAHRELGWPDGDREFEGVLDEIDPEIQAILEEFGGDIKPGWFEWSAPPNVKRGDIQGLAQANPSMNHHEVTRKCPTTRTLMAACFGSPAYEAETEVMCRWATMGVGGPFPQDSWNDTIDPRARPKPDTLRVVCVEVSDRRSQTYVARAGTMENGWPGAGIRYDHPGTDWVAEALLRDKNTIDAVVIRTDTGGSALKFAEELERKLVGFKILEWKAGDVNVGHQEIFDRLRDRTIRHLPHPGLDIAATSAEALVKPGGGFTVDIKKSPTDVGALYAVIGAVWGLEKLTGEQYNILESVI